MSPAELSAALAADPALIDVRTPAEFREAHVRGARNVPLDRLDPEEHAGQAGRLYVICHKGGRGAMACDRLAAAGVADVVNVAGGTLACEAAGLPIERGRKAISLERQVRIAAGSLVVLGVALGLAIHPGWLALAGFVGAGLVFAGVTDTCGMGMLLARMPWNQAGCEA
ncbi:MAG: rhodanese-like domain-containing protein [Planctomycetota bacterium]